MLLTLKYAEVAIRYPGGGGVVTVATQAIHPFAGLLGGMFILVDYFLTAAISGLSGLIYLSVVAPGLKPVVLPCGSIRIDCPGALECRWRQRQCESDGGRRLHSGRKSIGSRRRRPDRPRDQPCAVCRIGRLLRPALDSSHCANRLCRGVSCLFRPGEQRAVGSSHAGAAAACLASGHGRGGGYSGADQPAPDTVVNHPGEREGSDPNQFVSLLARLASGPFLQSEVAVTGAVLLVFASNTAIIGSYHVFLALSRMRFLPRLVEQRNSWSGTPNWAILIAMGIPLAVLLAVRGNVGVLGDLYAFGLLGAFSMTCVVARYRLAGTNVTRTVLPASEKVRRESMKEATSVSTLKWAHTFSHHICHRCRHHLSGHASPGRRISSPNRLPPSSVAR